MRRRRRRLPHCGLACCGCGRARVVAAVITLVPVVAGSGGVAQRVIVVVVASPSYPRRGWHTVGAVAHTSASTSLQCRWW